MIIVQAVSQWEPILTVAVLSPAAIQLDNELH
jgi:hypothetical protein